jgi:putative PIN family toxin of toxin-antitoxin system
VRVVLDTGVLVRANAKSLGPARVALNAILGGPHQLILSEFILDETARVMRYPRLLTRHGLSEQEIEEHIDFLRRISELVDVVIAEPVVLSDPDDDPVIYTALDGRADVLCTLDRHFFQAGVIQFCRTRDIAVMTDVDFLRLLVPRSPKGR